MTWVALVGPQAEESRLRSFAGSLARSGYPADYVPFESGLDAIVTVPAPPFVVALRLDSPRHVQAALSLALALRQHGYTGHIAASGRIAAARSGELLRDHLALDSVVSAEAGLGSLVSALACGRALQGIPFVTVRSGEAAPPRQRPPRESTALLGSGRPPGAVAAEMQELQRTSGVEIFVFSDDTLLPGTRRRNLEHLHALADAIERGGMGRFATVVRARATDVDRELFRVLRDRLWTIRVDLHVEPEVRRWSRPRRNARAIDTARELDLYGCLDVRAFAADTTLDSLAAQLEFMGQACDFPFRIVRSEPYAPEIERVVQLARAAFAGRDRLVGQVMAARFDLEVCRHFQPARHDRSWRAQGVSLTRALGEDSLRALRRIVEHVAGNAAGAHDTRLLGDLARDMREVDAQIGASLAQLAGRVASARRTPPFRLGAHDASASLSS